MNQERWQQVEALYHAALDRAAGERAEFLQEACPDAGLRREVESLIEAEPAGQSALDQPAWERRLAAGERLGPYEIVGQIGAGGMGEVWKARDTRLGRFVAIKICAERFSACFEREVRAIAALNHRNICTIHDVGPNYLVMELVEGEELKGPLPLETALDYARQIVAALEAAHEKGIVHRDLKPANIKVTPDGTVKLLDFGLAKVSGELSGESGSPTVSQVVSPTLAQAGVMLGTAAYMSPEQARAQPVDKRADIWAFGVVLYEMLTGRRLFGGDTLTDTIAAVVKVEPDWAALPPDTPWHIRRLLSRCLQKDPKLRMRDIGEARLAIEIPEPAQPVVQRQRSWLPLIATALAVAAVTAATLSWFGAKPVGLVAGRFTLSLPEGTVETAAVNAPQAVPSPDGRYLAFIAREAKTHKPYLWLRPMSSLSAHRLDGTEGANYPFWSPDGQFIAFFADQKLKKIAVAGGAAKTICDTGPGVDGGTWSQSGTIVFATSQKPLMRVLAAGGPATPVTAVDTSGGETRHSWPQFLPDGRHFVYHAANSDPEQNGIYVQELGASNRHFVLKNRTRAAYASGYLLFARETTLFAQRMNLTNFQMHGDPVPVAEDVTLGPISVRAPFAASGNGVLVYRGAVTRTTQLTWYDRDGKRLGVVGEPGEYTRITVSPDERYVALLRAGIRGGNDTWVMDLGNGLLRAMTFNLRQTYPGPVWSPDSKRVVVSLIGGGLREIVVASGAIRAVSSDRNTISAIDWSPDDRFLLCATEPPTQISLLPLSSENAGGTPKMHTILDTPHFKYGFRFSPGGQWVAYASNESGRFEVWVASFPSFAQKRRVSRDGGAYPVWRKDSKELFFATLDGIVMAAKIDLGSKLEVGVAKSLFTFDVSEDPQFGVSRDGERFLVNERRSGEAQVTVVLNWAAELK